MSDFIPGEIQVQILKLLPVKSLLRFRCVCKWWKQLIDSPSFVQDHLAVQKPQFIIEYGEPEFLVLDPLTLPLSETLCGPIEDEPKKYHLAGTLHGIVCLHDNHTSIYLWNPSIRKLSSLPFPNLYDDYMDFEWRCGRDYDYIAWTTYSAFWIDPSTKHFKIMLFALEMYETCINDYGAIYSSIKGNWKKMPLGEVGNHNSLQERPATVIGGVAYWTAYDPVTDEEGETGDGRDVVVLSFDFGLERFDIIPAPSVTYDSWYDPVVCKWQDTLSLVYLDDIKRCDIYLRQEGSWLHTFGFNITPRIWHVLWVLGETDERDKGLVQQMQPNCSRILSTIGGELVLLDTKGGCISLKSGLPDSVDFFPAYDFVESLLFP